MNKNFFAKVIKHFTNPLDSIFFDVRKIYWYYAKVYLTIIKKIYFPKTNFLMNIDYIDLLNLWNNIIDRKPKVVLEVGSGYSTFLIIAAIKHLNSNKQKIVKKFYSLEQNKKYLIDLKKNMTKSFQREVNFIVTDLKIEKINNKKVTICKNFPKDKINFFYEDRADHHKFKLAGDALKIETKMPKDYFICVDGMFDTVNFYKKYLRREYKINGGIFSGSNFKPIND